jgi:hypothetical protein
MCGKVLLDRYLTVQSEKASRSEEGRAEEAGLASVRAACSMPASLPGRREMGSTLGWSVSSTGLLTASLS